MTSMVYTKLEGYDSLMKELRNLRVSDIQAGAFSGAAGGARTVRDYARQNVINKQLVLTGALHDGIIMKKEKGNGEIITYIVGVRHGRRRSKGQRGLKQDPYYWFMHEFGTRRMPARPFLVPALSGHQNEVSEVIAKGIRKKLKRNKLIK